MWRRVPERVDLGPCAAIRHEGDPERCAIVLPGMVYPTRAPVLWFAREAAMAQGWSALEVLGEPGSQPEPVAWERECAERALEAAGQAQVLVIGKSLATFLAGLASERDLPAAWLTPALDHEVVLEGLGRASQPTLVLGGTADSMWIRGAIPDNPALEVVELPGVDHALQVPGDPTASLDALRRMVQAVEQLAAAL
jgi:pimeloyl-ACP methyl ester carboxylesterase